MKAENSSSVSQSPINGNRSYLVSISIGLLLLGILINESMSVYFNFTQDDAYITFRYAENFINGHGLVYNINDRVEGYTNFLWLLLIILGHLIGSDYIITSKIMGIFFSAVSILISYYWAQRIFGRRSYLPGLCGFIIGVTYSYAYWAVAGLETLGFTMCTVATFYFYGKRSLLAALFVVLASLFRPEGVIVIVFLLLFDLASRRKFTPYSVSLLIIYVVLILPFYIFKLTYFGNILPNPFYAKTDFSFRQLTNGLEYCSLFFYHYVGAGLFILPAIIFYKRCHPAIKSALLFLLLFSLYILIIGGDVLKVHRFFVPIIPFLVITIVYGFFQISKGRPFFWGLIIILIAWQIYFPYDHVTLYHGLEKALNYKMDNIADNIIKTDNSDFSLATSTIGIVGYRLMDHTVIDLLGLTDSTIARHPEKPVSDLETTWKESKFNSGYILSRKPDYILFSTGMKPSAPAEMSLFTYSTFMEKYRIIYYILAGNRLSVYKRYYVITGDARRDIDAMFVHYYKRGINQNTYPAKGIPMQNT
jgi:hypothetical protein